MKKPMMMLLLGLLILGMIAAGCASKQEAAQNTQDSQENTAPAQTAPLAEEKDSTQQSDEKDLQTANDDFSVIDEMIK